MREEYMIERQGKRFVLYAGLLEEAHARGLRSIDTELLQVPSVENGDGRHRAGGGEDRGGKFSGIGDASPGNVGRAIQPHIIRMAETRAKARALRDAINVGVTALEELSGDEPEGQEEFAPRREARPVQQRAGRTRTSCRRRASSSTTWRPSSPTWSRTGLNRFEEMVGKPVSELTRGEASEWIGRLSGRAA
jgi:hypothetical protein